MIDAGLAGGAQVGLRAIERESPGCSHACSITGATSSPTLDSPRTTAAASDWLEVELALRVASTKRVAAELQVLGEVRHAALGDVDVGDLGADVEDRDHLVGAEVVVGLERVLRRERVHVDDQRRAARPRGSGR